jgi:hypothetical protein
MGGEGGKKMGGESDHKTPSIEELHLHILGDDNCQRDVAEQLNHSRERLCLEISMAHHNRCSVYTHAALLADGLGVREPNIGEG